jgi:8-oxo-dGTP pyrophosphatase MutT (NUDIX family)
VKKKLSCGILFFNKKNELLLCHVTGNDFWDLPKGKIEKGETPIEAAIRETQEETGFIAKKEELEDIGKFEYNKGKDLHLFKYIGKKFFSEKQAHCEKIYIDINGKERPEMDDWCFMDIDTAIYKSSNSLNRLLIKLYKGNNKK